jgi:hypothetical protein
MKPDLVLSYADRATQPGPGLAGSQPQHFDFACMGPGATASAAPGAVFVHACEGRRWQALLQTLAAQGALVSQYRYIWLPDPSVQWAADDVARMFAICGQLGLDMAQPAFTPSSPSARAIAWQHDTFQVRFTNFVDPAAPVFSCAMLEQVLPLLVSANDDDDGAVLGQRLPEHSEPGRVAILDATPMQRVAATSASAAGRDDRTVNFGGLLDSGDALCLSARSADVDALLDALIRSCRSLPLGAGAFARYIARHLDAGGGAATQVALEAALAAAGLQFNRVVQPSGQAAAQAPRFGAVAPGAAVAEASLARELALRDADLRDLRTRYTTVLGEREQQAALLAELAAQLAQMLQRRSEAPVPARRVLSA